LLAPTPWEGSDVVHSNAFFSESAELRQYASAATWIEGAVMNAEQQRLPRFAVLIDADNTSPQIAAGLFEEVAKFGEASVRRIYGDFSGAQLKSWGGYPAKVRHRSVPAVRLHQRQERLRHCAGHRRNGPAA
jgi:hypothetical protein